MVYDVCNHKSYKNIVLWMNEAKKHIEPHIDVFILVSCKREMEKKLFQYAFLPP